MTRLAVAAVLALGPTAAIAAPAFAAPSHEPSPLRVNPADRPYGGWHGHGHGGGWHHGGYGGGGYGGGGYGYRPRTGSS